MVYKLEKDQPLKKGITQVAAQEVEECLVALKNMEVHEAVHDIRKRLKKIRALARLVRDEMGEEYYKSINIFYRDLGRELSPLRDLTAHIETIGMLRERYPEPVYFNLFNLMIKKIEDERKLMETKLLKDGFFSEYMITKLEHAKSEMVKWPVNANDLRIILPNIQRVYKRGALALQEAYTRPSKEIFHEWRKRVKYLWYQILLLQDLWPNLFGIWESEIHILADYLGNDHDVMIFKEKFSTGSLKFNEDKQEELINAIINEYSGYLRSNAKIKGELIYAETPINFAERLEKYVAINWN